MGAAGAPAPAAPPSHLPPVPKAHGPLALRVTYPPTDAIVDVQDSSFLFGSAGTGDAWVTVNGVPAQVWPNGGWVAWIPFPADSIMRFEIAARTPTDSARLEYLVRRRPRFAPPSAGVWIDSTSLAPRGRVWIARDEYLRLSARAAEGATVRLRLPGGAVVPLVAEVRPDEVPAAIRDFDRDTANLLVPIRPDRYAGVLRGRAVGADLGPVLPPAAQPLPPAVAAAPPGCNAPGAPCQAGGASSTAAPPDTAAPMLEAMLGSDTARVRWPLQVTLTDTVPTVALLADDPRRPGDADSLTVGRAAPAATYHWFFPSGTRALVGARINDDVRLALSPEDEAWVAAGDARALPPGTPAPRAVVGSVTITPRDDRVVLRIPVGDRLPFRIDETDRAIALTFYGGAGNLNWIRYGPVAADTLVRRVSWTQRAAGAVGLDVELARPVWGYRARWSRTDLLLEIRRPPAVDKGHPLRGRLVVVDPGHPPAGATGPTGLREADANLAVAVRLGELLRDAGARVVMTRESDVPVDLWPRVRLADSLGADLLISIHNNALPDGVNPFTNNGTSVFYNHPRSLPLARAIQRALVRRLGVRDLGVGRADLALARPTWMPAVLCEGLFMILPDQEHALRTPEGRELYARGVLEGIQEFLKQTSGR
ncbi:MAG TPA: N-acetylmuramoyl-L-alanine amidase [Gemmatimonadales bacterium]|nr:N-acetylmuramoyl-L-alanine amidase [Gemmatimonadales bacterium]